MDLWKEWEKFEVYGRNGRWNFVGVNVVFVRGMVNVKSLVEKVNWEKYCEMVYDR